MTTRSILVAAWLNVLLLFGFASGQSLGSISGTVLDEKGAPVVKAQVRVEPLDSRPMAMPVRMVETDKDGHFTMNSLALASYKLFAVKESAGYPNTSFAFYSNHMFPTVTLTAGLPKADITLKVGPPSGVILGTVASAVTSEPVSATFLLRRVSDPDNWISFSQRADYRALVPASVAVFVEVSAPGYKTWFYGGPTDTLKRPPIQLESAKEMKLDIRLEPEDKPLKSLE
jgi:hypothetical protein